jgi:ABC-type transport system substrate-binding protein
MGSGPFKFKEWVRGDHVTLVRNEQYFKPRKPCLDHIVVRITPDAAAATIAFALAIGAPERYISPRTLSVYSKYGMTVYSGGHSHLPISRPVPLLCCIPLERYAWGS